MLEKTTQAKIFTVETEQKRIEKPVCFTFGVRFQVAVWFNYKKFIDRESVISVLHIFVTVLVSFEMYTFCFSLRENTHSFA